MARFPVAVPSSQAVWGLPLRAFLSHPGFSFDGARRLSVSSSLCLQVLKFICIRISISSSLKVKWHPVNKNAFHEYPPLVPSDRAGQGSSGAAGPEQPPQAVSCGRVYLLPSPKVDLVFKLTPLGQGLGVGNPRHPSSWNYSESLFFRTSAGRAECGTELGSTGNSPNWSTTRFLGQSDAGSMGRGVMGTSSTGR